MERNTTPKPSLTPRQTLADRCQVSYDTFFRTTDPAHKEAVQHFWLLLQQRGYIYSSKHEGWYSVSDETFYPENAVHLILDPPTGRKMMASIETGKEVEWTSEVNYHFKLSEFQQPLLKFYKERHDWIRPKERMRYIIQQVEEGLQDLSISRPYERLQWGVRVPDDQSQTIYVWLDALINYITAAGYPWTPGRENALGWPANVQVIGKDIIRFHCIYWPAFLMALDIPLTNRFLAHAHWTLGNTGKMSKSSGNVVNPFFALDRFGVDTMRFYLAHDGGLRDDAAYDNRFIIERYKKNLQAGLGNLTSRVLRGKGWNVKKCISTVRTLMRDSEPTELTDKGMYRDLVMTPVETAKKMQHEDISAALKTIFALIHNTNRYVQARSPWHLSSNSAHPDGSTDLDGPPTSTLELETCIFLCAEALRISGILLQPFIPDKADQLLNMLGVEKERRTFEWTELGKDDLYGVPWVDLGKGEKGVLFPALRSDY
jgi:methionyl-tRNA synthetase